MKKEAHVYFLIDSLDGRSTHMPAGVMVYEWVREKHAFVNLTKVSPLVGLMVMVFFSRTSSPKSYVKQSGQT